MQVIEENKRILKEKYDKAKEEAVAVNAARDETNRLKAEIEQRRVERAMANIVDGGASATSAAPLADAGTFALLCNACACAFATGSVVCAC
ncbi:hypothetical protein EON66_07255 [archaeon]|nr:MAG: hypothetical protein EON66_07255 [archaeon]